MGHKGACASSYVCYLPTLNGGLCCILQLKILRQLVELQLCHGTEIKALIDRAWGVIHNKHKKDQTTAPPPPASDPFSQENLLFSPLGQDNKRKRYWIADGTYTCNFCTRRRAFAICAYLLSNMELPKHTFGILRPLIILSSLSSRLTVPSLSLRLATSIRVHQPMEGHVDI